MTDNNALAQQSLAERLMIARGIIEADIDAATDDDWEGQSRLALGAIDEALRTPAPAGEVGQSTCNKCGAVYPSAPVGAIHKCGSCSGGMMVRNDPSEAADMLERLAGPVQQPVIKLAQCYLCGTLAPEAFAAQCNRPECVYRQPVQQAGGDQVGRVRKALVSYVFQESQPDRGDVFGWIDDRADDLARAALAAMQPAPLDGEG